MMPNFERADSVQAGENIRVSLGSRRLPLSLNLPKMFLPLCRISLEIFIN